MNDFPITVNQTHWKSDSTFVYQMGKNVPDMSKVKIALTSATIPYSWFNISAALSNNTFSIIHPTSVGTVSIPIVLPDGGYELADINAAMRVALINAGYYIQNTSTQEQTVYCALRVNASTYKYEFVSYPLPTSLPSGFTAGSAITFPTTAKGPQLVVPNSAITTRLGFAAGTFPSSQPTTISVSSSSSTPMIADVMNVFITCDTAYNPYNPYNQVLTAISPSSTKFGNNINFQPSELVWCPQQAGARNSITFRLVDQNFRAINLNERNVVLNLCIRETIN